MKHLFLYAIRFLVLLLVYIDLLSRIIQILEALAKNQFKYYCEILKRFFTVFFLLSLMGLLNPAQAQVNTETEPNDTCETAQDFTDASFPFTLSGNIAVNSEGNDSDYYKFKGSPGTLAKIDLKAMDPATLNTILDVYMYVQNVSCDIVIKSAWNPNQLILPVPQDGEFIVFVTNSFQPSGVGVYTLTITPTNAIGSITGSVIDSITRRPLTGTNNTQVNLYHCYDIGCSNNPSQNPIATQTANNKGVVKFTQESDGTPLAAVGNYKITASSDQYENGETPSFSVAKNQNKQVDVPLKSYPARLSVTPCDNIPSTGGTLQIQCNRDQWPSKKIVSNGLEYCNWQQCQRSRSAYGISSFPSFYLITKTRR